MAMALKLFPVPLASSSSSSSDTLSSIISHQQHHRHHLNLTASNEKFAIPSFSLLRRTRKNSGGRVVFVGNEEANFSTSFAPDEDQETEEEEEEEGPPPTPEDLEYIAQIKRVLELLRRNRDMYFSEVKLTIMIEDPREVERRRLLGIDDPDTPSREELAAALEEVNEGKVPRDRVALQMLAEEMVNWPNLEVEAQKKKKPSKSLYARATDTGIDPEEAARRLKIDWDSAAEIGESEVSDDTEVPPAVH